jgi:deazaflavin-dependent oxidoreductase (nitroreductase family)
MDIFESALVAESLPDFSKAHIRRYLDSNGTSGHLSFDGSPPRPGNVPSLLLATRGRKSGRYYLTPLSYGMDAGRYVLIASKGGDADHPGWYKNLCAHARVRIQVGSGRMDATATTVEGADRERLWGMMARLEPLYLEYQSKTTRRLPVVVLTPDQ